MSMLKEIWFFALFAGFPFWAMGFLFGENWSDRKYLSQLGRFITSLGGLLLWWVCWILLVLVVVYILQPAGYDELGYILLYIIIFQTVGILALLFARVLHEHHGSIQQPDMALLCGFAAVVIGSIFGLGTVDASYYVEGQFIEKQILSNKKDSIRIVPIEALELVSVNGENWLIITEASTGFIVEIGPVHRFLFGRHKDYIPKQVAVKITEGQTDIMSYLQSLNHNKVPVNRRCLWEFEETGDTIRILSKAPMPVVKGRPFRVVY